jgi:hypothetical protein
MFCYDAYMKACYLLTQATKRAQLELDMLAVVFDTEVQAAREASH